ncbi:MAG: cob(I)yrinic acid a,c-diamide adenosyltransferase [Patescibacteria group bacterium]|nr:cob(I)yrinic acid a,c-diamide adenosyltransferase [Patescibacteria group bacterium]
MLIVFTGNGKGKTSAALGTALRSLGWNRKVAIIQFIKGNKATGEWQFGKFGTNSGQFVVKQFFDDKQYSISEKSILENPEYKKSCKQAWNFAKETILSKKYDLIILDEINNAIHLKLLDENETLHFVETHGRVSAFDIIMTGRNASQKLIDIADMVTEMKEIKHPFQKGVKAKEGIDY